MTTRGTYVGASAAVALLLAFAAPRDARADGEAAVLPAAEAAAVEGPVFSLGGDVHVDLGARGGFASAPIAGAINPLGLGGGIGAGVVLGHVYLGAGFARFAGGTDPEGNGEHSFLYGAEAGYEIHITPRFWLRPAAGFGGATITRTTPAITAAPASAPPPPVSGGFPSAGAQSKVAPLDVVSGATPVQQPQPNPNPLPNPNNPITTTTTSTTSSAGSGGYNSTSQQAWYAEPSVTALFWLFSGAYAGVRASALVMPNVSYGSDGSASWVSYAASAQVGYRF
jgi:hypothetical protein